MSKDPGRRLNSWKQIGRYLGRHVRTVRRWERKGVGMPVHRVPGGRTVFAYTKDLDAWLDEGVRPEASGDRVWHRSINPLRSLVGLALLGFAIVAWSLVSSTESPAIAISHVETANDHVMGYDLSGQLAWAIEHPEGRTIAPEGQLKTIAQLPTPEEKLFLVAATTIAEGETPPLRAELMAFGATGEHQWTAVRTGSYRFGRETFTEPWVLGALGVHMTASGPKVAWAVHHYTWWPSTLFLLDELGNEKGPFVNSGWITNTTLLSGPKGDLLLAGGISNSRSGAMVAVLDVDDIRGHSPEEPGSEFECLDCPPNGPLQYLVFPPSDVNRTSGLPYNQTTRIDFWAGQIDVTVKEGPPSSDIAWIYHFSRDFDLLGRTPGDSYWPTHRLLELEGKLDHDAASCPWNAAPMVRSWTAAGRWTDLEVADSNR
jgi:hypothetical protein